MTTEIFVEGKRIDVSADISNLLTFALDDVSDFASRQTTYSKTVVVPGTSNNNAIFGNIFEMGLSNDYDATLPNLGYNFNASKSAQCVIFQDFLQTFKGTMRLIEVDIDNGRPEYQIALNGTLTTLSVNLSSALLTDLDFSAYNLLWTAANIAASWDNTPGSGVYFPMADYGSYSAVKHDWSFATFRPALYVKEYIDKIFAAAGFRYNCDLFNTDRFKRLVVPHNQKVLQSLASQALRATNAADQTVLSTSHGLGSGPCDWSSVIGGGFTNDGEIFTYTQPTTLSAIISWTLDGTRVSNSGIGTFTISIRQNGVEIASQTFTCPPTPAGYRFESSVMTNINNGDTLEVFYHYDGLGTNMIVTLDATSIFNIDSTVPALLPVDYGQKITLNDAIPANVLQVDFLVSIVQLFNLYIYEDQFDETLIYFAPFVGFYETGPGSVVDWTQKMDRSQVIKIQPMTEINSKLYKFNYASDSDYYNDLYNKRYNQGYGSYIFDSQFEFSTDDNTLTLVFAPTPLVGYQGEQKIYSTIFKRTGDAVGVGEETVDSTMRILQTKKIGSVIPWNILRTANDLSTSLGVYTAYGYGGHYDDPTNPNNDLNFGGLAEVFFFLSGGELGNTQFNVYWSSYMAEITDKDSKMLTGHFYLTPQDIFNLKFSRFIVIDGVLLRLNKITDYNTSLPSTCEVQLLNSKNISFWFPPGSEARDDYALMASDGEALIFGGDDSDMTNDLTYK